MRLEPTDKFWVVTKATDRSILVDIMFQADLRSLALTFRGSLDPATILLLTDDREAAHDRAVSELQLKGDPNAR